MLNLDQCDLLTCDCGCEYYHIGAKGMLIDKNGDNAGSRFDIQCVQCGETVGDVGRSTLTIRDRIEPVPECTCADPCYESDTFTEARGESGNMPLDPTMWVHCLRCDGKAPGLWAYTWDGEPARFPRYFEWVIQ